MIEPCYGLTQPLTQPSQPSAPALAGIPARLMKNYRKGYECHTGIYLIGKPVFIIAEHYGLVGEISFYLPEAKDAVREQPLVYHQSTPFPRNQFFYWPGYTERKGENAIFVRELDGNATAPVPAPDFLLTEFESVTDLGIREVKYRRQLLHPLQFFSCRGLK